MILSFPTGSNTDTNDPRDGIAACMYFMYDGTWLVKTEEDMPEEDQDRVQEFVDFISFATAREDFVEEFRNFKEEYQEDLFDAWRRENFELILGGLDTEKKEE